MIYLGATLIIIGIVFLIKGRKPKKMLSFDIETTDLRGKPYYSKEVEEYVKKDIEHTQELIKKMGTVMGRIHRNVGKSTDPPNFDPLPSPTPDNSENHKQ